MATPHAIRVAKESAYACLHTAALSTLTKTYLKPTCGSGLRAAAAVAAPIIAVIIAAFGSAGSAGGRAKRCALRGPRLGTHQLDQRVDGAAPLRAACAHTRSDTNIRCRVLGLMVQH